MERQLQRLVLGAEWDHGLRERLLAILGEMGAELFGDRSGLGGSQDIDTLEFSLEGRQVVLEAETYVGLTLTGPSDLVERIRGRLAQV